jgi:hypothetical protein
MSDVTNQRTSGVYAREYVSRRKPNREDYLIIFGGMAGIIALAIWCVLMNYHLI